MRKRKPPFQHRFDLYQEDDGDMELHNYLLGLAETNKASDWMRGTLKAILTAQRLAIDVPATLAKMDAEMVAAAGVPPEQLSDKPKSRHFVGTITTRMADEFHIVPDPDEPQYVDPEDIP